MSVTYRLVRAPFNESLKEVQSLAQQVFGRSDEEGTWRYDHMPDFTLFEARVGERLVGF